MRYTKEGKKFQGHSQEEEERERGRRKGELGSITSILSSIPSFFKLFGVRKKGKSTKGESSIRHGTKKRKRRWEKERIYLDPSFLPPPRRQGKGKRKRHEIGGGEGRGEGKEGVASTLGFSSQWL